MGLPGWAFWLALIGMLVGLLGIVLPAVPGVALVWLVALVYALAEHFATIDPLTFVFLSLLGLAGATADLWLSLLGAKAGGASLASTLYSLLGALVGGVIGFLLAGVGAVPGMIAGSILGIAGSAYLEHKEWKAAWKATLGLVAGWTLSTLLQLAIGLAMLALFIWQARTPAA
jgi:uncharacterized protein YqgC (DUF456 family)